MFLRVFYFLLTLLFFSCTHKYEKKKPAFGKMTITVGGHDKTATINTSEYTNAEKPFTFAFKRSELEHDHDRTGHEHSAMDLVMNFTSESPISDAYIDIHPLGEEMHNGQNGHVSGGAHNMPDGFTGRMTLGNTGDPNADDEEEPWKKTNGSFITKGTQLILSEREFPTTDKMPDFGGADKKYKVEIGMTNQDGAAVSFAFILHVED